MKSLAHFSSRELDDLVQSLDQAAETLRREEPLLDAARLRVQSNLLKKALQDFLAALPGACIASHQDYHLLRGAWLEAWSSNEPAMEASAARLLGDAFPSRPAQGADRAAWELRLLALCLLSQDVAVVRGLIESSHPATSEDEAEAAALAIDRGANEALRSWGRLDVDELLGRWDSLDPALLRRACHAVGLALPKQWSRARKEDFHRRARRFARNTLV